ncbi:MAG: hypothetical protein V1706_03170 [Pseudomonadota bacterium]
MLKEMTVYNPEKGRLETVAVEFTTENTTWFDKCRVSDDITMIADFGGDLLVSENNRNYPVIFCDMSRESVGYDQKRASNLLRGVLL